MKKYAFLVALIVLSTLYTTGVVFSAGTPTQKETLGNTGPGIYDLTLNINPESPEAGDTIQASISSFSFSVDAATIEWFVDGIKQNSGVGMKTFSTQMPETKKITIGVRFTTPEGKKFTREKTIQTADVDLLWESPVSYTPPFYKGKALPSSESQIRFVAIPATSSQSSLTRGSGFIFNWQNAYQDDSNASGVGKDVYSVTNSYLNDTEKVGVSVSDTASNFSASAQESVNIINPILYFYNQDPLLGTDYTHALIDRFTMTGKETTLVAAPYFVSPNNFSGDVVTFDWSINGTKIQTPTTKNKLIIRNNNNNEGDALIGLDIASTYKLFGEVAKNITVTLTK